MINTQKIIENFTAEVIKMDASGSVLIGDKNSNIKLWVDVWSDNGEIQWDWNQYIFHLDNPNDVLIKEVQENIGVAVSASELAMAHYELNIA